MAKHTAGEWRVERDDFGDETSIFLPARIMAPSFNSQIRADHTIALVGGNLWDYGEAGEDYDVLEANARLLAKAWLIPELVEALELMNDIETTCLAYERRGDDCRNYPENPCRVGPLVLLKKHLQGEKLPEALMERLKALSLYDFYLKTAEESILLLRQLAVHK